MVEAFRTVGPLRIAAADGAAAMAAIAARASAGPVCVAFANTHLLHFALRDAQLASALQSFLILNDGVGLSLIARLVAGAGFPENLNGTDFTPRLLLAAPKDTRVFLLGGRRAIVSAAARRLPAICPNISVCGVRDGYEDARDETAIAADICASRADFVLIGMGNPSQELLISRLSGRLDRGVLLGVGALFDFLSGSTPRAPIWLRRARLEWLYRLQLEPARLWKRYSLEIFFVLLALMRERLVSGRFAS